MKAGTLFSGIGGFDLAFQRAGIDIAYQVEIDKHCQNVLATHYPEVTRYDDVSRVHGAAACPRCVSEPSRIRARLAGTAQRRPRARADEADADCADCLTNVDVLCGGFPCQDLSVAGKRAGLAGERSGLWHEFRRLIAESTPRWVLIENVPGLLSSNQGEDFAVIVEGLVELGYGLAWRVLDAQYFGVPQRRRRVFIVGCLGDSGAAAASVLFEPESVSGDHPPRRKAKPIAAGDLARSLGGVGGGQDYGANKGTLIAASLTSGGHPNSNAPGRRREDDENIVVAHALNADRDGYNDGSDPTYIPVIVPQAMSSKWAKGSSGPAGDEVANLVVAVSQNQRGEVVTSDYAHQLTAGGGKPGEGYAAVLIDMQNASLGDDQSGTLQGEAMAKQSRGLGAFDGASVRRLTPTECERLQGFPDGWTAGQADSTRYRQLGNAVAVPVVEWIARRIVAVNAQGRTAS